VGYLARLGRRSPKGEGGSSGRLLITRNSATMVIWLVAQSSFPARTTTMPDFAALHPDDSA
jgi:hypothetical protein